MGLDLCLLRDSSTWHYDVDGGRRVPPEAHRVAEHLLGRSVRLPHVPSVEPAVAVQRVDVVRQSQQPTLVVLHFQLQEVAGALQAVHALLHVDHAHQREPAAEGEGEGQLQPSFCLPEQFLISFKNTAEQCQSQGKTTKQNKITFVYKLNSNIRFEQIRCFSLEFGALSTVINYLPQKMSS